MGVPATATHPELPDASRQAGAAASATRVDGDLPDLAGAVVVSVDTVANIAVGDVAWGLPPDHRLDPGSLAHGLPGAVPDDVPLVVQVRDAGRRPEVLAFLRALAEEGRPAVVVEWGWPSTRDVGLTTISARGSSAPGVAAVTQLLRGSGWTR
jgi:beta-N-acetylhexosaminidase